MKFDDKVLLAALFLLMLLATVGLTVHGGMDETSLDWSRSQGNLILGALLGLITGKAIYGKSDPPKPPDGQ